MEFDWVLFAVQLRDPASGQVLQDRLLQKRWVMPPADGDCFEQCLRAFGKLAVALASAVAALRLRERGRLARLHRLAGSVR